MCGDIYNGDFPLSWLNFYRNRILYLKPVPGRSKKRQEKENKCEYIIYQLNHKDEYNATCSDLVLKTYTLWKIKNQTLFNNTDGKPDSTHVEQVTFIISYFQSIDRMPMVQERFSVFWRLLWESNFWDWKPDKRNIKQNSIHSLGRLRELGRSMKTVTISQPSIWKYTGFYQMKNSLVVYSWLWKP